MSCQAKQLMHRLVNQETVSKRTAFDETLTNEIGNK